jgi:hypothetical protein
MKYNSWLQILTSIEKEEFGDEWDSGVRRGAKETSVEEKEERRTTQLQLMNGKEVRSKLKRSESTGMRNREKKNRTRRRRRVRIQANDKLTILTSVIINVGGSIAEEKEANVENDERMFKCWGGDEER